MNALGKVERTKVSGVVKLKRKFYDENRLFEDRPGAEGSIPWFGDD